MKIKDLGLILYLTADVIQPFFDSIVTWATVADDLCPCHAQRSNINDFKWVPKEIIIFFKGRQNLSYFFVVTTLDWLLCLLWKMVLQNEKLSYSRSPLYKWCIKTGFCVFLPHWSLILPHWSLIFVVWNPNYFRVIK